MSTSPWDALTRRRPSAAEVKDTQERMNLVGAVTDLQDRLGEVEQASQDVADHLGYAGDDYLLPVDDGTPPAAPTGLVVTPVPYKELDASWDVPLDTDQVVASVMEVTPSGGSASTYPGTYLAAYAAHLTGGVSHSVRVKLIDRWGRESAYCAPVTATPMFTAAEQIDLDALAILGRLQGLLPNANLTTITDATKLGSGVVLAQAMAVQDAVAINLWVQNAAIQSAKIATMVADKITTGTLSAATITLAASGSIKAGSQVTLNASGISMAPTATEDESSLNVDYKISDSLLGKSVIHFYNEVSSPSNKNRGVVLRAEGNLGDTRSQIVLHSAYGTNAFDVNAARVEVRSRRGGTVPEGPLVVIAPELTVEGDINANGNVQGSAGYITNYTRSGFSVGAGNTITWTHGMGQTPTVVTAYSDNAGDWQPLPRGGGIKTWVDFVNSSQIKISNTETFSLSLFVHLYK